MSIEAQALPKERIANYLYFSSLYFVSVGILYLWGYWSTFDINILEYLSLADILKLTAYPITTAVIAISISGFIGVFAASNSTQQEATAPSLIDLFLIKYKVILLILYILVIFSVLVFGPILKWHFLPAFFALPITIFIKHHPLFIRLMPNMPVRVFVLMLLTMLFPQAYGTGKLDADKIVNGRQFSYAISNIDGVNFPSNVSPSHRLRFLGRAGEFVFFINPTQSSIFISQLESGKSLVLKRFLKSDIDIVIKSHAVPEPKMGSSAPI